MERKIKEKNPQKGSYIYTLPCCIFIVYIFSQRGVKDVG